MPERVAGLTVSSATPTALSSVLGARSFLDVYHDFSDRAALVTITDEVIIIPASGLWDLNHVPDGDVEDTADLLINTSLLGAGTDYAAVTTGTPVDYQVLVNPTMPWRLTFPVAHAGNTVYATYETAGSVWNASLLSQLWEGMRSSQQYLIGSDRLTVTAGEALTAKRLGYINHDTFKCYMLADPTNMRQIASLVYIPDAADAEASTSVIIRGSITPDITPPVGYEIRVGRNSQFTWADDTGANKLVSGDRIKPCGTSRDGTTILFDANLPIGIRVP